MSQNDQLKSGDTSRMEIGGCNIIIEPIPYGRLKKLYTMIVGVMGKIGSIEPDKVVAEIPGLFEDHLEEFLGLAFDLKKHPFLNKEWVEENVTLVDIRRIGESIIAVNGIKDFLGLRGKQNLPPVRTTTETEMS